MADEFQPSGNWWDTTTSRNQFDQTGISSSWSSSLSSLVTSSSMLFQDSQIKLQTSNSETGSYSREDPNLHLMGLGLSYQPSDWNQALLRGDQKADSCSFRSMLQDNTINSNTNYSQETGQWRSERLFSGDSSSATVNEFKPINQGFSLDQPQFSPQYSSGDSTVTCQRLTAAGNGFQMDSSGFYGNPASTILLTGLVGAHDHNQSQQSSNSMNYPYNNTQFAVNSSNVDLLPSNWSKVPNLPSNFSFWNNSSPTAMKDFRPSFFHSSQTQFHSQASTLDEKPKNISETRDSDSTLKKSVSEASSKRPRNETPSPLPAFKVRKEKMGDRITALQQLVSPFGKTDTASVLSEAIEYIKFLHGQVTVLSTPYLKSGANVQHQQNPDKSKDTEGPKQDLRSRGLCLVPVSSTFPVTHESTVDFWTPTFGGTFR